MLKLSNDGIKISGNVDCIHKKGEESLKPIYYVDDNNNEFSSLNLDLRLTNDNSTKCIG